MKRLPVLPGLVLAALFTGCQPAANNTSANGAAIQLPTGDPARGRAAFVELQCWVCHQVAGWKGEPLPRPTAKPAVPVVLGAEIPRLSTAGYVNAIISPSHKIAETRWPERTTSGTLSRMGDYNDVMTVRQLADVAAFLEALTPDVVVPPTNK